MDKIIYLDYAATTPVRKEVLIAMLPYFDKIYGNPSSIHQKGIEAKKAIENAREKISKLLNCAPNEIVFTNGGTESINLALKGFALANKNKGNHIITQETEHSAVLNTCKWLEKNGFKVTYIKPDKFGLINPKQIKNAITKKTILVSIMYANNEIGTIQPIGEIGKICKEFKICFHSDACQAAGFLDLDVKKLNIDMLTLNGSKIYGPKGIGLLYVKNGIKLEPLIHGGEQEFGLRAGTENVPGIIGLATALELAQKEKEKENKRLLKLRNKLINEILKIPHTKLNGHPTKRLPNNISVSFYGIEGEALLLMLDREGFCVSTGSACSSKKLEESHVLKAIGLKKEWAHGTIRITLGKYTTNKNISRFLKILSKCVEKLRAFSPIQKNG
ncbi:MAG: cysteine desulfurase family protein [Candidatus Nanoarchaeia archaeon]